MTDATDASAGGTRFPLLDTKLRLSVPYNHADDYIPVVLQPYLPLIAEVFLPIHVSAAHTGRPWRGPLERDAYDEQVATLRAVLDGPGVPLSFVANTPLQSPAEEEALAEEIVRLHALHPTANFTLQSWEIATRLHRRDPGIALQPSTLAHVNGPTVAWYWKIFAGSRSVTLCRSINRKPDLIEAIRKMGLSVRAVANDDCLPGCPAEADHYRVIRRYDEALVSCACERLDVAVGCRDLSWELKATYPWIVAQKELLPGHLRHVEGLVDLVKIVCRSAPSRQIAQFIEQYASMEGLTHKHADITEPPEAWEKITTCDRVCEACGWCERHIRGSGRLLERRRGRDRLPRGPRRPLA